MTTYKRRVVKISRKSLCKVDHCYRYAMTKGLCTTHYRRVLRYGDPNGSKKRARENCSVPDCMRQSECWGLCGMHYQRKKRLGSEYAEMTLVRTVKRVEGDWRVEVPSYSTVHRRLRTQRGLASDYRCVACGGPAKEWALSPNATDVLTGTNNGYECHYTKNLEQYQPMCSFHHRQLDAGLREAAS